MEPTPSSSSPENSAHSDAATQSKARRREDDFPSSSLIVCSVGTDHHPFDRLVEWVDKWAAENPLIEVIIQYGTADKPKIALGEELIPHKTLRQLFARATLVISHGGPSTVMDARMAGKLPVVLARNPALGEHVDEHQMVFSRHLSTHGLAISVNTEEEVRAQIERALAAPEDYEVEILETAAPPGVVAFGQHLDQLLGVKTELEPAIDGPSNTEVDIDVTVGGTAA